MPSFYIKLGAGGEWEPDSIATGKLRFGWRGCSVADMNARNWPIIQQQIRAEFHGRRHGAATTDFNALKRIVESSPDDVWITFHQAKLWWTTLSPNPIEEDGVSRFRWTAMPWSDQDANGRLLVVNDLPGKISTIQGFRGTVCRVKYPEVLQRTLNGAPGPLAVAIDAQRTALVQCVMQAITDLHWKDFEILVDLVFRAAGWSRVSVLGQQARDYDLELREPITRDRYVVQVKSEAGLADLERTIQGFSRDDFRSVFFVVHSPHADLLNVPDIPPHVDVVLPERLAELAVDAGLAGWIRNRAF
jgi:hypothetical protein